MLIKPNWEIFRAKFSENPQDNFEWFCYLLFSKEYNQPYGTHRYKNQSGIETDPIEINGEVIGWQSKFYEDTLSNHKEDLLGTLTKTKRDNPNITKIILYTNAEWGQGQGTKEPKAKMETKEKAEALNIELIWRTRSYFESPFVCQDQRDISRYFFELDSKWELTPYGFLDTLKSKYLNDFKTISLLTTKTPKPIDEIFVNLAIIKEKKEEKGKDKTINREALLNSYEEIRKQKGPIDIEGLIRKSNKSLIYGKAGIGKTTLCKYIAYKWAKEELYSEFEYLIYIPLREWKSGGIKGAIRDYYYSLDEKNISIDFDTNKTLFLFDGYDELEADKKKAFRDEIDKYTLTHYLITTRPYGYQKSDFRVDECFDTIGFTDEDVEKYIDNFFGKESEKVKGLNVYLETNISIRHIGYIPLMLEMICSLWEKKEFGSDITMTELYGQVIENMLKKHSANKDDERVYRRKNRKKIQEQLGKLAFEGLTQQTILFDGDFIEKSIDDIGFFEENVIYAGFLKSDVKEKDLLDNSFEFPHLTFQEYFSALYVSTLSKEEQSEVIRDWKFYSHMKMFFIFFSGLIEDKEFLFKEIESEPRDLVGVNNLFLVGSIISYINLEEFSRVRIESINRMMFHMIIWLSYCENEEGIEVYEELYSINYFIDNDFMEMLTSKVEDENMKEGIVDILRYLNDEENISSSEVKSLEDNATENKFMFQVLNSLNKKNSDLVEILDNLFKENRWNFSLDDKVTIDLVSLAREDNRLRERLIFISEDKNVDFLIKLEVAKILLFLDKKSNKFLKIFMNLLKDNDTLIAGIFLGNKIFNILTSLQRDDDDFIDVLIAVIQDTATNSYHRGDIIHVLTSLSRRDEKYINKLICITKDKNINISIRIDIVKILISFDLGDDKGLGILINFIKDEKIRVSSRIKIAEILIPFERSNHLGIDILVDVYKNENIDDYSQVEIVNILSSLNRSNDKIAKILMDFIENGNISYTKLRAYIAKSLSRTGWNDDKFMDILVTFIQDETLDSWYRLTAVKALVLLDRSDKLFIDKFICIIENEDTCIGVRMEISRGLSRIDVNSNKGIDTLLNFLKDEKVEFNYKAAEILANLTFLKTDILKFDIKNYFPEIFIKKSSTKSFMYAFDNNYIDLNMLIENAFHNTLPLYLKNNKLHTIENGKEISTQREVDEATLNEIKMMLREGNHYEK